MKPDNLIIEAYVDMLTEEKFKNRAHWAEKVAAEHQDAEYSTENGVHVARKDGELVAKFKYDKGVNAVSGSGNISKSKVKYGQHWTEWPVRRTNN